jgi:hypothetical protein
LAPKGFDLSARNAVGQGLANRREHHLGDVRADVEPAHQLRLDRLPRELPIGAALSRLQNEVGETPAERFLKRAVEP